MDYTKEQLYVVEELQKILSVMVLSTPFIMPIIKMDIDFIYDKNFAIDGNKIYYNPKFFKALSKQEKQGVILYEWLGIAFMHSFRALDKNLKIWNMACSFEKSSAIIDYHDKDISLPEGYMYDLQYKDKNAEQIYIDLMKTIENPKNGLGGNGSSFSGGNPKYLNKDQALGKYMKDSSSLDELMDIIPQTNGEAPDSLKEEIIFAAEQAKKFGNLPACLERKILSIFESKADWKTIFAKYFKDLINCGKDRSFAFPKKWAFVYDIIIPSDCGFKKPKIVVIYDTSGSILNEHIQKFNGELKKMLKFCSECTVMTADTKVHEIKKIKNIEEITTYNKITFKGGGGTSFVDALKQASKIKADTVIYLTDGEGTYGKPPKIKNLLWVLNNSYTKPPFGKYLVIN